jgi:hypothetical protein
MAPLKALMRMQNFDPSKYVQRIIDKGAHSPQELKDIAMFLGIKLNGVLSMYHLPKKLKRGSYIILMTPSPDIMNGHWVAVYNDAKGKKSYYFDSYGMPPPEEVLHSLPYECHYNENQIQALNASHCGMFCLLWLNAMNKTKDKSRATDWMTSQYHIINNFSPSF